MPRAPQLSSRARTAIGLLLCLLVTGVSLLFFSPLHRHDPGTTKACIFTQFEHGNGLELPVLTAWVAPLFTDWLPMDTASPLFLSHAAVEARAGRAPPSA